MNAQLLPVQGASTDSPPPVHAADGPVAQLMAEAAADAMLAWQPDWRAWPLNRALRLKAVVVRDEAG
uniref:hypothetical protein n=1 Tax=Aquabacterium sp. UBA2148 TaxID=1946042 RepID=UPI00257A15CD